MAEMRKIGMEKIFGREYKYRPQSWQIAAINTSRFYQQVVLKPWGVAE